MCAVLKSTSCCPVADPIFTSLILLTVCFLESCDFFFCAYRYLSKSVTRHTGGVAVDETSTRSRPRLSATLIASRNGRIPTWLPSASITRTSCARIRLLTRIAGSLDGGVLKSLRIRHLLRLDGRTNFPKPAPAPVSIFRLAPPAASHCFSLRAASAATPIDRPPRARRRLPCTAPSPVRHREL